MMDLYSMIEAGGRMNFTVTGEDLVQFAEVLIERAVAIKEAELAMMPKDETYLTTDEVVEKFHVCKTTLWHWEKSGYLIPSRWGKRKTYALSELLAVMKDKKKRLPNPAAEENKLADTLGKEVNPQ